MGWSIGFDSTHDRYVGYGVPATCDHPDCTVEIDRGLSYVCGSEPLGGEHGCGLYFCPQHLGNAAIDAATGSVIDEDNEDEAEDAAIPEVTYVDLCERCRTRDANGQVTPFPPKPDHPTWMRHQLRDSSWAQWRKENPEKVRAIRAALRALDTKPATEEQTHA